MNQIVQFIKWNIRDFLSIFKNITAPGIFAMLGGAQIGSAGVALVNKTDPLLEVLSISLPITAMLFVISLFVSMQWDRFKSEQQRIMDNLK